MSKKLKITFIALFFLICFLPLLLMPFVGGKESIGNEQTAQLPSLITEQNTINQDFGTQFEKWFNSKIPFRSNLITVDNTLKTGLLGYSHNNVIAGKNGYLFSNETLADFVGDTESERAVYNVARTLQIMQMYCEQNGSNFLFTAIPNKNTIEFENMPDGYKKGQSSTLDILQNELARSGVNFLDMKSVLSGYDDELYLKNDTHWNNLGALYGFNSIMDALGKEHKNYDGANFTVKCDWAGDLSKMLYPSSPKLCDQYYFDIQYGDFAFIKPRASMSREELLSNVMGDSESLDTLIQTRNSGAQGSLYLSRDSFSRAILPYLFDNYASTYITRLRDFNLLDINQAKYSDVVYEIAERNIATITNTVPMIYSPLNTDNKNLFKLDNDKFTLKSENTPQGLSICGLLNDNCVGALDDIYVELQSGGNTVRYEAFPIADKDKFGLEEKSEYGFSALIDTSQVDTADLKISVLVDKK